MLLTRAAFVGLLVGAGSSLSTSFGADSADARQHTVVIDGTRYEPATLTIKRGESVTWLNKDPFPHTATSKGRFDSRDIGSNKRWTFVAKERGQFEYICTLHPNMKGTLKVE